jgi:hypothetical protein
VLSAQTADGRRSHVPLRQGQVVSTEAFRTGAGMGWHEDDRNVFIGCEQFFRPGYIANLIPSWIPALDGVEDKLQAGAPAGEAVIRGTAPRPRATWFMGGTMNMVGVFRVTVALTRRSPGTLSLPSLRCG